MSAIPTEFTNVTAVTKANVYFDGKVVSHSILFADGSKKTLGGIVAADLMRIVRELAYRHHVVAMDVDESSKL